MPKLLIFPAVDAPRLERVRDAAPTLTVVNAPTADAALAGTEGWAS